MDSSKIKSVITQLEFLRNRSYDDSLSAVSPSLANLADGKYVAYSVAISFLNDLISDFKNELQ